MPDQSTLAIEASGLVNMVNLTRKLMENTITLCKNAQFQLSDTEIELIHRWMKG